jgi:hypothetical protein
MEIMNDLKGVNNPNIVFIHNVVDYEKNNELIIIMELCSDGDLL